MPPRSRLEDMRQDDQKKMYLRLLAYADQYLPKVGARLRGVHLLFQGGASQLALTYLIVAKGILIRKYSIILANPASGGLAEFVFTFGATPMSFTQFCQYTYWFDEVVASLSWD